MRRPLLIALPVVAALIAAAAWWFWPHPQATVKTGTIVMCTQGEMVSNDTRTLEVDVDEVGEYGVKTKVVTCDRHKRLAVLREQAEAALAAGDLAAARVALEEIVKLDPADSGSSERLASVRAGKKPAASAPKPSGGDPVTPGAPDGDNPGENPSGPNADLTRYMPDTLKGFVAQGIVADPFILWRDYVPSDSAQGVQLVVMAEQHGNESSAQAAIDSDMKTYYPNNAASFQVEGRNAYFGTRSGDLALLAITDGSVRFVLELTTQPGKATAAKTLLTNTAMEILR